LTTSAEVIVTFTWDEETKAGWSDGWLVRRLTSPFSTKIGHIADKVLGGDSVHPR